MTFEEENEVFKRFMRKVDEHVQAYIGLSHQDLPDFDFYSAFRAGETAIDVARDLLQREGFYYNHERDI